MRYLILGIFLLLFLGTPVYLLEAFVMPSLDALQQTYADADAIATRAALGAPPTGK